MSARSGVVVRSRGTVAHYGIGIARPLYFRHESSLAHDTGPHPEGPGRIPAIEGELERHDWLGYERRSAPRVEMSALEAVHPRSYVEQVRELSSAGGGAFDPDTSPSAGSSDAPLHAPAGQAASAEASAPAEAKPAFAA